VTGGHRGRKALLLCLSYNGRIKVTVRDHWWNSTEQLTESQLTFDAPLLAILFPSHRFRTEGGPYGYGDQTVSQGSLSCLVGWTPPGDHPNPALYWDCSWGTIPTPYQNPTAYVAGSVAPGEKVTPAIRVFVDAEQRTRNVEVFGDHLKRDMQNFMGGTNTYPLIWWEHLSNCHGATEHAHTGGGTLVSSFWCSWCDVSHDCVKETIYDRDNGKDEIDTFPKRRGDIVEYASGPGAGSHSATLTAEGTATWEVNGGIPSNNHFRQDVVLRDLAPIIRLHGPPR